MFYKFPWQLKNVIFSNFDSQACVFFKFNSQACVCALWMSAIYSLLVHMDNFGVNISIRYFELSESHNYAHSIVDEKAMLV